MLNVGAGGIGIIAKSISTMESLHVTLLATTDTLSVTPPAVISAVLGVYVGLGIVVLLKVPVPVLLHVIDAKFERAPETVKVSPSHIVSLGGRFICGEDTTSTATSAVAVPHEFVAVTVYVVVTVGEAVTVCALGGVVAGLHAYEVA